MTNVVYLSLPDSINGRGKQDLKRSKMFVFLKTDMPSRTGSSDFKEGKWELS